MPSRKVLALVAVLAFALVSCDAVQSLYPPPPPPEACSVAWVGEIDLYFARIVKKDLLKAATAGCKRIDVSLLSPGGSVIWSVEVSQEIKRARAAGMLVAIHGRSLVASGAVVVLSAGTPGLRSIAKNSLVVVHAVKRGGGFSDPPQCVDLEKIALDNSEDGKATRQIITMLAKEMAENSNKPLKLVSSWLLCGKEQIGAGRLLVQLGLADTEE